MRYLQLLKKTWYISLILDLLFFISSFGFLYYIRTKVITALNTVQQYAPQLQQLQNELEAGIESTAVLDSLLSQVQASTQEALIFGTIFLPLGIFLLWVIINALHYKFLAENRLSFKYFMKYLIFSIPFFIAAYLTLHRIATILAPLHPLYGDTSTTVKFYEPIVYLVVGILLFGLLLVGYSVLSKKGIILTYKHSIIRYIKQIYIFLPLTILFLVSFFGVTFLFFEGYVNYISYFTISLKYHYLILGLALLSIARTSFFSLVMVKS